MGLQDMSMHEVNGGCKQLLVGKMFFPPYFLEPGFLALKKLLVLWPQGQKSTSSLKNPTKTTTKNPPPKKQTQNSSPKHQGLFCYLFYYLQHIKETETLQQTVMNTGRAVFFFFFFQSELGVFNSLNSS